MIEKTVLDYLNSVLPVTCYMEEPENPPVSYVLLEKTGESGNRYSRSGTFAIQSYGETMLEAAELNELVKTSMDSIAQNTEIYKSRLNSSYNFTDTTTRRYRYQAVYDLVYYEED